MTILSAAHYDRLSRWLHWLTAAAVLVAFILGPEHFGGQMRKGLDPSTRLDIVAHETLGSLIFALTVVRLLWLRWRPAPPVPAQRASLRVLTRALHGLLWLLLLALPVTALLALGSEGHPLTMVGLRINEMPWIAHSALATLFDWGDLHGALGDVLMVLAGLHASAALVHHTLLKDNTLRSMLPPMR